MSRILIPATVGRYARRDGTAWCGCQVIEADATADEQEVATYTAAIAVVDHLRRNDLYREAGEGTNEIVELSHWHTWSDRDDPGGESRQHGIAL
jgi:hypothetical protein